MDLAGNKYYYFKPDARPPRRILQSDPKIQFSDVEISPSWHQWLRHTRPDPPSIQEQQQDVMRQQQLKHLAAAADARWANKPSVMDRPRRANQELGIGDGEGEVGRVGSRGEAGRQLGPGETGDQVKDQGAEIGDPATEGKVSERQSDDKKQDDPWRRKKGIAGEGYQPEAWTPGSVRP